MLHSPSPLAAGGLNHWQDIFDEDDMDESLSDSHSESKQSFSERNSRDMDLSSSLGADGAHLNESHAPSTRDEELVRTDITRSARTLARTRKRSAPLLFFSPSGAALRNSALPRLCSGSLCLGSEPPRLLSACPPGTGVRLPFLCHHRDITTPTPACARRGLSVSFAL